MSTVCRTKQPSEVFWIPPGATEVICQPVSQSVGDVVFMLLAEYGELFAEAAEQHGAWEAGWRRRRRKRRSQHQATALLQASSSDVVVIVDLTSNSCWILYIFQKRLPLILPVLLQLAIDSSPCSSGSDRKRGTKLEVLWFSATEHLLLSACSLGRISRRGWDTWVNSPSFEAADLGQPVILAAGQLLAFPSSLSLSFPSRFPNCASLSAGRVFCYLYEA